MGISKWIEKIFGNYNTSEINRIQQCYIETINDFEPKLRKLNDESLAAKTSEFKFRLLENNEPLENILPEAFATVREVSSRVLNMRHFDVQMLGGVVLHEGRIAEMKTGEGKTLVSTLPAYLNALTDKGVHIVTVNDYLAKRDSEWMGQIHKFLGISVGLINHDMDFNSRKIAYNANITYGTNNEFGFDYLRDNMVVEPEQMVQRSLNYAIVDEVDSILIDEARTPLVISGPGEKSADLYNVIARIIPKLIPKEDYIIDEKAHNVALNENGIAKIEKLLSITNLYEGDNMELAHHIHQALKAHTLMHKDKDYVVKDGEVVIVDEFTGRLVVGRRYSDGLHQAIEAKEGIKVQRENQTLASITFQNYFRIYNKLAGMTGTAKTEEQEFRKIYGIDVIIISTHKPMIRKDYTDVVFKNKKGKYKAVIKEICNLNAKGQPVLVGTTSIAQSEQLSEMLKKINIKHNVLNAKFHELEAQIIAQAGQKRAVTIATNMAGRGTDIVLGKRVSELGGLHILGTERHESRRIDNQLRGRSGRQGDPGSSRFFLSLEDDLMRLFGDNISYIMDKLGMDEDLPIQSNIVSKTIERAQKKIEAHNFSIRKYVLEYDDIMNIQRKIIYDERRKILYGDNLRANILAMSEKIISKATKIYLPEKNNRDEWDINGLIRYVNEFIPIKESLIGINFDKYNTEKVFFMLCEKAHNIYNEKEKTIGSENMRLIERTIMLKVIDARWLNHLNNIESLKQGIGLRALGQKDPLIEYKIETFDLFQQTNESIQEDIVRFAYRVNIIVAPNDCLKEAKIKFGEEKQKDKHSVRKKKK